MLMLDVFPSQIEKTLLSVTYEEEFWPVNIVRFGDTLIISNPTNAKIAFDCKELYIDFQWARCDAALIHWMSEENCPPASFFVALVNGAHRALETGQTQYLYEYRPEVDFMYNTSYDVFDREIEDAVLVCRIYKK